MSENNEYLVYGDDQRVEQEKLDELAEKADKLMEIRSRAVSKSREKNRVLPQPSVGDSKHVDIPEEELGDISEEENLIPEENDAEEKSDTVKKKPRKKPKPLFFILIGILCAVILTAVIMMLKKPSGDTSSAGIINPPTAEPAETEQPANTENPDTPADSEPTPEPSAAPLATEGYLKQIDIDKEYALSDTLAFAKSINDVTQNYLNKGVDEVVAYQRDQTRIISENLSTLSMMLDYDIETLKTYETMFDTYGGVDYIRNAESRLSNVKEMYAAIGGNFASTSELVDKANEYITIENEQAQKAKDSLLAYLDSNGVVYHLEDDQINYDSMQFINNISPEPTEEPAEAPSEEPAAEQTAAPEN